jgi:hypothetical protein
MQCAIITGASTSAVETAVNAWLESNTETDRSVEIKYATMSEGTIGTSTIKVIIFYEGACSRAARA